MCLTLGDFVLLGFKGQAGLIFFIPMCVRLFNETGFGSHFEGKNEVFLLSDLSIRWWSLVLVNNENEVWI